MAETNNLPATQAAPAPPAELTEREQLLQTSWGKMGVQVARLELTFQATAESIKAKIVHPQKIEDVQNAEKLLAQLRKEAKELQESRLKITNRFNDPIERLMAAEKSLPEPLKKLEASIIEVKKKDRDEKAVAAQKLQELTDIKTAVANLIVSKTHSFKEAIANRVHDVYVAALEQKIHPSLVDEYITEAVKALPVAEFTVEKPKRASRLGNTQDEIDSAINEKFTPFPFVGGWDEHFRKALEHHFSDYEVAFHNAEAAKEQAENSRQDAINTSAQERVESVFAVGLESSAPVLNMNPGVKALKQAYVVDLDAMGNTHNSFLHLCRAFAAHKEACLEKLQVKKWFNFTGEQIATALGKIKSADNTFAPANIIFKVVDKL